MIRATLLAVLLATSTVQLLAQGPPERFAEDPEGYCATVHGNCFNQCYPSADACFAMQNSEICWEQYGTCMDDCYGLNNWWCNWRAF